MKVLEHRLVIVKQRDVALHRNLKLVVGTRVSRVVAKGCNEQGEHLDPRQVASSVHRGEQGKDGLSHVERVHEVVVGVVDVEGGRNREEGQQRARRHVQPGTQFKVLEHAEDRHHNLVVGHQKCIKVPRHKLVHRHVGPRGQVPARLVAHRHRRLDHSGRRLFLRLGILVEPRRHDLVVLLSRRELRYINVTAAGQRVHDGPQLAEELRR
mmetsp:Transcript_3390/g.11116  ORF Transcript_3390/g.11116 Transcript_3390/m.11116 type:complete len:210 (+) Transcript_3390:189-818(+)